MDLHYRIEITLVYYTNDIYDVNSLIYIRQGRAKYWYHQRPAMRTTSTPPADKTRKTPDLLITRQLLDQMTI